MTTASASAAPVRSAPYDRLISLVREASLLASSGAVLGWDQETMMPPEGVEHRSAQLAQIARLSHEMYTNPEIGDLLAECEDDADLTGDPRSVEAVNLREIRRDYDRRTRLPASLVEEEARLASKGQHVWAKARKASDFEAFRPTLEKVVDLLKRKAECYGWADGGEPWDALAEDYEPGCTAAQVQEVFVPLRERLKDLLTDLMEKGTAPSNTFNEIKLPIDAQEKFVRFVSEAIGFDYERGRLDRSTHPFCSGSNPTDVRLTTRFHENNVNDALGSTMHESGHGIYEQGLLPEHFGTPMGESVSLGIHESQSRMWENQVGRSRAFWEWCFPKLKEFFGSAVDGLSLGEVYAGANIVKPDFIRVEADEATYNMHIMVRFELERAILGGRLDVKDIPGVWNAKYLDYLGIEVPDEARGCLQDIHWSMTSMGYFPTYTLGNLYAAQFFEAAERDLGDLATKFRKGEFADLKAWLNESIHRHGRRYRPAELCEVVTGEPLSAEPLMRHLEGKLRPIYGV